MNDVKHHAEHTTDEPASVGAEIEHTILNSSQSHPISVKLEKKKAVSFIILLFLRLGAIFFFFLRRGKTTTTTNSEQLCKMI